jgi:2,3-bisphosphoglycerate-independent phosphoglycerate mutase
MIQPEVPEAAVTARLLNELTLQSQVLLENHPVNLKRAAEGKDKANSIWLWSPGYKPEMKTLMELYDLKSGSVISAVDLIKGIGVYAGLKVINVEGATGLYNTNYEGKAQALSMPCATMNLCICILKQATKPVMKGMLN